jgi:hypothetical protein
MVGIGGLGEAAVRGNVEARRAVPEARSATSDEKLLIDKKPQIAQVVFTQFPTFLEEDLYDGIHKGDIHHEGSRGLSEHQRETGLSAGQGGEDSRHARHGQVAVPPESGQGMGSVGRPKKYRCRTAWGVAPDDDITIYLLIYPQDLWISTGKSGF